MRYVLIALLFLSCSKNDIEQVRDVFELPIEQEAPGMNVKEVFGAVGNGIADDWEPIQRAIDSAVKIQGKVFIPRGRYKISKPLMVYKWAGTQYAHATAEIIGEDLMWSGGTGITVIIPTFKDAFCLGIQQGKGVVVRGLYFDGLYVPPAISIDSFYRVKLEDYGDLTVRRDRYSPYAAVVVDPFSGTPPNGGGYPTMQEFYRGPNTASGSTGLRFEDMTFRDFDIGAITSPNGTTRNAEIITFENIRITNCRIGIAGTQSQEKQNRIINVGAWGATHTLFAFAKFGALQPGHWYINGVNIAGQVANLLYRPSGGWFPMYIDNVFAESLGSIGLWYSTSGDAISNSSINFIYPDQVKAFHFSFDQIQGVTISNSNFRIYGQNTPMVFSNATDLRLDNLVTYVPPVYGKLPYFADSVDMGDYILYRASGHFPNYFREGTNIKASFVSKRYAPMVVGDIAVIVGPNAMIEGMCKVSSVGDNTFEVDWISGRYDMKVNAGFYIYKKK